MFHFYMEVEVLLVLKYLFTHLAIMTFTFLDFRHFLSVHILLMSYHITETGELFATFLTEVGSAKSVMDIP